MTAAQIRIRRMLDESWRREAACQSEDPNLFFLEDGERWTEGRFSAAEQICRECPVSHRCDEFAELMGEKHGYWGHRDRGEEQNARRREKAEAKALQEQS